MLKVKIHNDGKEKYQSFDASLDDMQSSVYLDGYGSSKEEAVAELKKNVELKIKELLEINYDDIEIVDCLGNKIK